MPKTNPYLSLWLSAANAWTGAARGFWMAELRRQQTALMTEMMQQTMRLWTGAWLVPPTQEESKRRHSRH
ncbi:MAG TPA: hypothetical protein VFO41_07980 [Alphaproteobacteria bacterium]|nr:hypothetical protein [Alphaproteobacteria bacterium]